MQCKIFMGGMILKANLDIRREAKAVGVHLWECAEFLDMHDSNFYRKLRRELPQDEKDRILTFIRQTRYTRGEEKDNA